MRLAKREVPKWADDEKTVEELQARIRRTIDLLATVKEEEFNGREEDEIFIQTGSPVWGDLKFTGKSEFSFRLSFFTSPFVFPLGTWRGMVGVLTKRVCCGVGGEGRRGGRKAKPPRYWKLETGWAGCLKSVAEYPSPLPFLGSSSSRKGRAKDWKGYARTASWHPIPPGYVLEFVLPNFFFHIVTAYAILRKEGVEIGKKDYLKWKEATLNSGLTRASRSSLRKEWGCVEVK